VSSGLEVLAIDTGRGFADFQVAMRDGHSTARSLGHGLGAVKRNTDSFDVFSVPSKGSAALCRWWDERHGALSRGFVVQFSYPISPASTVVVHSDGLGTQWDPADYPGLWTCDPSIVAGVLYRDFTRRRDDVMTVVAGRAIS
jgi:hypothetical protein